MRPRWTFSWYWPWGNGTEPMRSLWRTLKVPGQVTWLPGVGGAGGVLPASLTLKLELPFVKLFAFALPRHG